jgi:eukaryotic-like serine/threonine-protein kinase
MAIVEAALELPVTERDSYVARACGDDLQTAREALSLLRACDQVIKDGGFLADRAADVAAPVIAEVELQSAASDVATFKAIRRGLAGRYDVDRELGRGGMATVYLGRDERYGRPVAIKVIHPELTSGVAAERFQREIAIVSALRHPHIVPLFDSGEVDGLLFYVMPYVAGESLRQRLDRERQLDFADAIAIARDVADALDYAHAHGIVHRDVKPQNILVEAGHAFVADFGIARAVEVAAGEELTASGVIIGTPQYVSPEQASGDAGVTSRSDLYSLACVVYEMLGGEPPFTGPSPRAVLAKHMNATVPSLRLVRPTAPVGTQRVLERGLAKVPADRFATATEFVRQLATCVNLTRSRSVRGGIVAAVLVAASGFALALSMSLGDEARSTATVDTRPDPRRVAVLYFDDLSPTKALGHVADGLTEDLIDVLSQVSALRVTSPNGVREFRHANIPLDTITRVLDVGTIVAGSIARSDERLRLTVRLIDAATGQQLQSRTLQQRSGELFRLQDSLTAEVAVFLRERLGREIRLREQRAGTRSVRAWEYVQEGEGLTRTGAVLVRRREEDAAIRTLLRADSVFARAQGADPAWVTPTIARGWVALSLSYVSPGPVGSLSPGSQGRRDAEPARVRTASLSSAWIVRGLEHADHALGQRPNSPEALALRGDLRYRLAIFGGHASVDSLLSLAEADLSTSAGERPDLAGVWYSLGDLYYQQARLEDASRALTIAFERDAFLTEVRAVVARLISTSLHTEQFDVARSWCALAQSRFIGDPRFGDCRITLLGWTGRGSDAVTDAWRQVREVEQRDTSGSMAMTWSHRRLMVAAILARSGNADSARAVLGRIRAEVTEHPASVPVPLAEAHVRTLLGDRDAAIDIVASVLAATPDLRAHVARSPWFRSLRSDPRFSALVRPQT